MMLKTIQKKENIYRPIPDQEANNKMKREREENDQVRMKWEEK